MSEKKLVLFDVDGTLTEGGMGHFKQIEMALKNISGRDFNLMDFNFQGTTDRVIAINVLQSFGFSEKEIQRKLPKYFEEEIRLVLKNLEDAQVKSLPGVKELLQKLGKMNCRLGLVTGNPREIAFAKLRKAGIADFFQLGGFGDDIVQRQKLVEAALTEAKLKFNESYSGKQLVIVGDTRHDIDSGKPFGAKTIAVVTGGVPEKEVKESNPDYLFKDLTETEKVLEAIFSD
jgi:phosphoglycolate phosphatase-like HAD superfamily hydrolase